MPLPRTTRPNQIRLKPTGRYEEARCAATLLPGYLVQKNSDGELIPHAVAGGPAERAFALEDALQGRTINDTFEVRTLDGVLVGDLVPYELFSPGDEVFAVLKQNEDVDEGDALVSGGDGTLVKGTDAGTGGIESVIAYAGEALNPTAADAHIVVRIA